MDGREGRGWVIQGPWGRQVEDRLIQKSLLLDTETHTWSPRMWEVEAVGS